MKLRKGFVSNSSSTSFIIGIPDEISAEDKDMLELFVEVLDGSEVLGQRDAFLEIPSDIIESTKKKIDDLEKDIFFLEDYIDDLETFLSTDKNIEIIEKYFELIEENGMLTDEWRLRSLRGQSQSGQQKWMSFKGAGTEPYQRRLKQYKDSVETLKKELELYEQCKEGYDFVAKFKIDNWASAMEKKLQALIKFGVVKLLDSVYN